MRINLHWLAALCAAAFLLTGCSDTSVEESSEAVEAAAKTSEPADISEPVEPLSPGDDMTFECSDLDGNDTGSFTTLEEAWKAPREERVDCDITFAEEDSVEEDSLGFGAYTLTDVEQDALKAAGYEDEPENIRYLYNICVEADMGDFEEVMPWSESQNTEVGGALVLCPDHPDRDTVELRMAKGEEEDAARSRGEIFNDGTYKVGEDIQPGTYVAESEEPFEGCYWERVDASGNTIDNNFVSSGFRVQVTIGSADYSFTAERCGEWKKQ